ncbi:uncharacterized protein LOC142179895 [Nicotiana tabacum]|uniref:Uncharacterized protein LOC142179895 n=1 Tax=Nicotiana tabacum TaxID=4097 RepID=A0AC58UBM2_TOBAC
MEIKRDRHSKKLYLYQKEYLKRVIDRFGMNENTKPVSTPLAPHFKLSTIMPPKNEVEREYMSRVPYANAIGSLMYAMSTVALSTIEAEYMVITEAVKEAIWLQGLLRELGVLFQLPGNQRHVEFGSFTTNGKAILLHTLIFFVIFTILILAVRVRIFFH